MAINVKVEGLDVLVKQITDLPDKAMPILDEATDSATRVVHYLINAETPEDTGELATTIKKYKARRGKNNKYRTTGAVEVGGQGAHVELGHDIIRNGSTIGTVEQKPFMRPAADRSKKDVKNYIQDAMNDVLKKYGGGE